MTPLLPGSFLVLMALLFCPLQQADYTGDWYFDRFGGPNGEISHTDAIDKANKQEAGYKFTFTKDGKFRTVQSDGTRNTTDYQYIHKGRLIVLGRDTMKIVRLTATAMALYPTNGKQPTLYLRRNKEVKGAGSAP